MHSELAMPQGFQHKLTELSITWHPCRLIFLDSSFRNAQLDPKGEVQSQILHSHELFFTTHLSHLVIYPELLPQHSVPTHILRLIKTTL